MEYVPAARWISVEHCSRVYSISRAKLYRMIKEGALETALVGGSMRRIDVKSADRLFAAAPVAPRPSPKTMAAAKPKPAPKPTPSTKPTPLRKPAKAAAL